MKKIISVFLIFAVSALFFTACGSNIKPCGACNGSGYYQKKTCPICKGSGHGNYDPYKQYKNIGK